MERVMKVDLDWSYLRQGTVPLLAGAALCSALAVGLWYARTQAEQALANDEQTLSSLEQQRSEMAERLAARQQYAAPYARLVGRGVAASEQRLSWVQSARSAAQDLGLPYLRYSAAPQRTYTPDYLTPGLTAPVLTSRIELQAGLVHEQDLLRIFQRLETAPGMFQVRGCTLERVSKDAAPDASRANLTVSCEISWFSIPPQAAMLTASNGEQINELQ
jgi:hypothetical protein